MSVQRQVVDGHTGDNAVICAPACEHGHALPQTSRAFAEYLAQLEHEIHLVA